MKIKFFGACLKLRAVFENWKVMQNELEIQNSMLNFLHTKFQFLENLQIFILVIEKHKTKRFSNMICATWSTKQKFLQTKQRLEYLRKSSGLLIFAFEFIFLKELSKSLKKEPASQAKNKRVFKLNPKDVVIPWLKAGLFTIGSLSSWNLYWFQISS